MGWRSPEPAGAQSVRSEAGDAAVRAAGGRAADPQNCSKRWREYDLRPHKAVERIEVAAASREVASILGVRPGDPLLSVTRTTVDAYDVPFEYSHDRFVADRTRIVVKSPGSRDSSGRSRIGGRVVELRGRRA